MIAIISCLLSLCLAIFAIIIVISTAIIIVISAVSLSRLLRERPADAVADLLLLAPVLIIITIVAIQILIML